MSVKRVRTLHSAMSDVLKDSGNMRVCDLVDTINSNRLYLKKDLSALTVRQIYARVNKYPELFSINQGIISLV